MEKKYYEFLRNKNLSDKTIKTYKENIERFFKNNGKLSIQSISNFIKKYSSIHSANSTRLMLSSLRSYLKFKKMFELERQCSEIKLPTSVWINRNIISMSEFNNIEVNTKSYYKRRNWIIFSIIFLTGIRLSELKEININNIYSEFIQIKGKGQKWRSIYFPEKLLSIIRDNIDIVENWKKIVDLSNNQIYKIIKSIGKDYFNKEISPHSLRRSYATNLINSNINIKIISKLLGHSSIETTSKYLYISLQEIKEKLESVF